MVKLTVEKNDNVYQVESRAHPLLSLLLFFGGTALILVMTFAAKRFGINLSHAGRFPGLAGLLPAAIFFLFFFTLTSREKISARPDKILIENSLFFIYKKQIEIKTADCGGVKIRKNGRKGYVLYINKEGSDVRTMIAGKEEKIREAASEISRITGAELTEIEN